LKIPSDVCHYAVSSSFIKIFLIGVPFPFQRLLPFETRHKAHGLIVGQFKSFTTQQVTRHAGNNATLLKISQPVLTDNNF
jgi:hypothetical protein